MDDSTSPQGQGMTPADVERMKLDNRARRTFVNLALALVDSIRFDTKRPTGPSDPRHTAKLLIIATDCLLSFGMTTKARAVGRWGEMLRRAWARREGW